MKRLIAFLLVLILAVNLAACVRSVDVPATDTQPLPTETEAVITESLPLWQGRSDGSSTTFYYDLDGDGTKEKYLFGVDFPDSPHTYEVYQHICGAYSPGAIMYLDLFPCVWRVNSDGTKTVADSLIPLLEQAQGRMWRLGDSQSPDPQLTWDDPSPGAASMVLKPVDDTRLIYEVTAEIGGTKLSATAMLRFIPEDVDMTHLSTTPITEPLERWTGSTNGRTTTFRYDLDGDGVQEKYLFGVDFSGSPSEAEVLQDISGSPVGGYHERILYPCVWRIHDDGTKTVETAFASFLEDTQAQLWRVGKYDVPDPELWSVDYLWPGTFKAEFVFQTESRWLYRVTTTIDGKECTAQAMIRFIHADAKP